MGGQWSRAPRAETGAVLTTGDPNRPYVDVPVPLAGARVRYQQADAPLIDQFGPAGRRDLSLITFRGEELNLPEVSSVTFSGAARSLTATARVMVPLDLTDAYQRFVGPGRDPSGVDEDELDVWRACIDEFLAHRYSMGSDSGNVHGPDRPIAHFKVDEVDSHRSAREVMAEVRAGLHLANQGGDLGRRLGLAGRRPVMEARRINWDEARQFTFAGQRWCISCGGPMAPSDDGAFVTCGSDTNHCRTCCDCVDS